MSIDSTKARLDLSRDRLTVPWLTVLPFAVVMAYADGFWVTSLQGAVGAIERSGEPFTTWWRESTLVVPLYVLAVLGAFTVALRRYGPVPGTPARTVATAVLVAAAGTVVGIAEVLASTAYDYLLQSDLLQQMASTHGTCVGSCLQQAQQSTLAALASGVLYAGGLVLVSNLLLVGWVLAMRGGRLTAATSRTPVGAFDAHRGTGSRAEDLRIVVVAGLLAAAHLHAAAAFGQLAGWPAAGLFFLLLAAADVVVAAVLLRHPGRGAMLAAAVICAGPVLLLLLFRIVGPGAGRAVDFGLPQLVATAVEVVTLFALLRLSRSTGSLERRPPMSAHARALTLVSIVAVTLIGLAGTSPTWFDQPGSSENPSISHEHG